MVQVSRQRSRQITRLDGVEQVPGLQCQLAIVLDRQSPIEEERVRVDAATGELQQGGTVGVDSRLRFIGGGPAVPFPGGK